MTISISSQAQNNLGWTNVQSPLGYPVRTVALPPEVPAIDNPLVIGAIAALIIPLGALFTWFLLGGIWSAATGVSTDKLRDELERLDFLFQGQADSLSLTKSGVLQAFTELDKMLARVFMSVKVAKTDFIQLLADFLFRGVLLVLNLILGPLQAFSHLLGLLALKLFPKSDVMTEYNNWLENRISSDTKALNYIRGKRNREPQFQAQTPFPDFYNQFDGINLDF